ncbi:MAG: hypothetical protein U1E60_19590 [Reyranellaceae bacterium]
MRRAAALSAVALALATTACGWPEVGTGGMAERQGESTPPLDEASVTLDRLTVAGADRYAAADTMEARLLLMRARREHAGGLASEASNDLARLNAMLERIEMKLGGQRSSAAAMHGQE